MKPLVLYHANCWDGFCAAWVARKALGDIEAVPVQYGTEPPVVTDRKVYILDFSYPRRQMRHLASQAKFLIVLDHHKTAQEALDGFVDEVIQRPDLVQNRPASELPYVQFDMTKSGGRLAWEHFNPGYLETEGIMAGQWIVPDVPWLVSYTEDRDLWRHTLTDTESINAALRSYPLDFELWDDFAKSHPAELAREGQAIRRAEKAIVDTHVRNARAGEMDGHRVKFVNATVLFSEIAGELAKGAPFGACYFDRQDGKRQWSLRSDDHGVDVSAIAKAHGGGGHVHAAGWYQGSVSLFVMPTPVMQWLDDDGKPLAGGLVYTYAAGSTTPLTTYFDNAGAVPHTNPIVLDAEGKATIYLSPVLYKFDVKTAAGVSIDAYPQDNIAGAPITTTLTVPLGGTGVTTLAAHGVVVGEGTSAVAVTTPGTAGQVLTSNGGAADPTFQALPTPAANTLTLIGQAEGTSTAAVATSVASFAITGLTVKDSLRIVLEQVSVTQATAAIVIYNTENTTTIAATNGNALLAANTTDIDTISLGLSPFDATNKTPLGLSTFWTDTGGNGSAGGVVGWRSALSIAWTGAWTLALRHGGVTAGGTYYYRIAVYKLAGQ